MPDWNATARRIRVPLGFAFTLLYLWLARPTWQSILIGGLAAIPGLWLRAWASGHVTKATEITTTGPYAYTRNPLYLGSLILAAGFGIAARSPWLAAALLAMLLAIYFPVIRWEEAYLRRNFPEFEDYARRVPRLLPRLGPGTGASNNFSWERYRRHREYNALLGTLAMLAALAIKLQWFTP
ncbi:MAG TPA: isoprenylcysteine carboxylmethyltransferase family protein [Terriglobales bacterium]|nr:isoprenylcysteine carboxylmethyltransferase family protein [Terriglobales bacterium]